MDQERRIKDLEDEVRSLNIRLSLVSVVLAFNALWYYVKKKDS